MPCKSPKSCSVPEPAPSRDSHSEAKARKVKLIVAYDGTDFHGWQYQPRCRTVEGVLESALGELEGVPVDVDGASRTDQGVHALGQTASFSTRSRIPTERLCDVLNARLPVDLRLRYAESVADDFHARHSAVGKCYRYLIDRQEVPSVLLSRYALHVSRALDVGRMQEAAAAFIGEQDFASFQCQSGQVPTRTVRRVDAVRFHDRGAYLAIDVWGRSFLYRMVRSMVGTLLEVGRGRWAPDRVAQALASRDRSRAGPTLPPQGLTLGAIYYSESAWQQALAATVDVTALPGYHSFPI